MMSLKTSNKKMRRGFMCHSQSSTAVCMNTRDPHSVVVPKRIGKTVTLDDTRIINFAKYSKLVQSPMSNPVPRIMLRENSVKNQSYQAIEPRELQKTPTDNVFQVCQVHIFYFIRLNTMQISYVLVYIICNTVLSRGCSYSITTNLYTSINDADTLKTCNFDAIALSSKCFKTMICLVGTFFFLATVVRFCG